MLMRKNYNGLMNDLFSAGVTLFVLVTGKGPFMTATPHSGNYQYIAMNYFEKFWSSYEKKCTFSEAFKNLINCMLAFDPTYRLSISEILSHQWTNEEVLTSEEVEKIMKMKIN
jgi:serine/threonine protein kinase